MKRLALLAVSLGLLTCPAQAASPSSAFLHVAHGQVVDGVGRTVILRGVNVDGLEDYATKDLKPPLPTSATAYENRCPALNPATAAVPLCKADLGQIAHLGFDVIRLPVSWSLLEPTPGHLDPVPLQRIAQVVGWARGVGVRVVIDMHQDAWSKFLAGATCPAGSSPIGGSDGAPAWASTHDSPACAPGGTAELSSAVQEAAQRFWLDLPAPDGVGLQEHYATVVTSLASRFHNDPTVAGYEIMNEPQPGFAPGVMDATELMTFQAKVVDTVVSKVPGMKQLFFVEPGGTRNVTAARTFFTPWSTYSSYKNVVYAPHIYTGVFTADSSVLQGKAGTLQSSDSDYAAAVGDAKALGLPLWVGEFGNGPSDDRRLLAPQYAHQDAYKVGGALWIWKETGSWGALSTPDRVRRISTAYPSAVPGVLDTFTSDPFHGTALVRGHSARVTDRAHAVVIVLPSPFTRTPVVTGATYEVLHVNGIRQLLLYPRGGAWQLRIR